MSETNINEKLGKMLNEFVPLPPPPLESDGLPFMLPRVGGLVPLMPRITGISLEIPVIKPGKKYKRGVLMKNILVWLWQLPQNIAGLVLIKLLGARETIKPNTIDNGYGGIVYWFFKPKNKFGEFISGVSLGNYIVLKTKNEDTIRHKYGHSKQSKMLGWFYLIIVGIPSIFNNLWDRYMHKNWDRGRRLTW